MNEDLAEKISAIGEIGVAEAGGKFVLCHRDEIGRHDLREYKIADATGLAKFDDAGKYRPLKTAPNLQHGWKVFAGDLAEVAQVINAFYPARLAILRAFKSGRLRTTPLRETLNRQSGIYRAAAKISDSRLDQLVGEFCRSDGGCLRTILWKRDESGASASSNFSVEKFDPAVDQFARAKGEPRPATAATACAPLLCQEGCNLLVAEARKIVKQ